MIELRGFSFLCHLYRFGFINDLNIFNITFFSHFLPFLGVNISEIIGDGPIKFTVFIKSLIYNKFWKFGQDLSKTFNLTK